MRPNKKRKHLSSDKDSVPARLGSMENISIYYPWIHYPNSKLNPVAQRTLVRTNGDTNPHYSLIYYRLELNDYHWLVAKGPMDLNTGICKSIERAMRNADACLKKATKCKLLGSKYAVFA